MVRRRVLVTGGAAPWISHNTFRRNKGVGLAARDGAKPLLRDNTFEKNGIELPPELMDAAKAGNLFLDVGPTRHPAPGKKK